MGCQVAIGYLKVNAVPDRSKSFGSLIHSPKTNELQHKMSILLGNIDILRYSEDILMDIDEGIASIHTNVIS